ncbi:NAD(P)/FAD-dependent oxidoreductase [Azonexus sp. IMCC34839]|uniref:NAD(P)/FAD-dependent oxidoreductase n=1 Tax=Azonexus sp. IMCC34839 TaxID=3133695 RepID=UPI00399B4B3D
MQRDILIVGAGIFGASIAFHLARAGLGERVLLLERGQPAGGATSRAAALLTQVRDDPALIALVQETFRAIATLEDEFAEDVGRRTVGALHAGPATQADALRAIAAHAARFGIAGEWLEGDAARTAVSRRAPWLAPEQAACAVFFPDECFVEPYLLSTAYQRAAGQLGVKLRLDSDVCAIRHADGQTQSVELTDGTLLPASIVINAAGAWANLLSVPLGLPLPMAPVRSQYWISEPAECFPRDGAIVLLPEIRAYARPEVGALLFGVREKTPVAADPRTLPADLAGFVFDPDDAEGWNNLAEGADYLLPYFPRLESLGIAHYITGPSNYTPDGRLILGRHPDIGGLFVATGCNGNGIAFSGGVGRFIADLVCDRPGFLPADLAAGFAPARVGQFDPFSPEFLNACAATRSKKRSG